MIEKEISKDINFSRKCNSYGADSENFKIIDDMIVLNSPKKNIFIVLDENYNTIGIYDKNEESIEKIKDSYINGKLPYPFQNFTLNQIYELSNRVYIYETNHGHSVDMFVNGEFVSDDYNNIYTSLLLYVKFLGQQIEEYFTKLYQMKMMGFEFPDVYQYTSTLVNNIDECIDENISKDDKPTPSNVLKYLGQTKKDEYDNELCGVINLLLAQKCINKSNIKQERNDLSIEANKLLKILEVSIEDIRSRYQDRDNIFEFNEINLQSWLSEDSDKSKQLVK